MITTIEDLEFYLNADRIALHKDYKKPKLFSDEIWKFQIYLRKYEFYNNSKKNFILKSYYKYKYHKMSIKLGFSIPINVFGAGLSIAHYGTIVVNNNAKIGRNCRIHENVTIGATNGNNKAPQLGDNIFIGSGAKIIGDITIGSNNVIGAGAIVVKDFVEDNVTIAGVPAKIINSNNTKMINQEANIISKH